MEILNKEAFTLMATESFLPGLGCLSKKIKKKIKIKIKKRD